MLFLSFLLLGQSAGLDANTSKAASQCILVYAAEQARTGQDDPVRGVSQVTYLGMAAARAEGLRGAAFIDRAIALLEGLKPVLDTGKAVAVATPAECDKRFPFARATAPAQLPQNPADRDILCISAVSLIASTVEDMPKLYAEFEPLVARFEARLDAAFKAKGVSPADEELALGEAMRNSLDFGNADTIAQSCRKLPA